MKSPLRGPLAISLSVQGIGSFAPFLTIILLARLSGPAAQGTFSTFKTWADLVSSVIVFGFPQAFVYLINKGMVKRYHLLNISFVYVGFMTLLIVPAAMLSVSIGYNPLPDTQTIALFAALVAFGVGAVTLNRLVRAIYLTIDDGLLFSLITSAPAFFVMIAMIVAAGFATFSYGTAYFVAGILTCLATAVWIRAIVAAEPGYSFAIRSIPKRALAEQSLHTFAQSISFTVQPVATIYFMQQFGAGIVDVAAFTAATIVIAAVNVFFGIVSPIFFNRWSAGMDAAMFRRIRTICDKVALVFFAVGAMAIPLYRYVIPIVFGPEYVSAIPTFEAVSWATGPVALTRIISSAIHAAGRPGVNTVSGIVRLTLCIAAQFWLSAGGYMSPLTAAVWSWVFAEWAAALWTWCAARSLTNKGWS